MSVEPTIGELGEVVATAMERLHVPGVAVGVLHEDREEVAGFGVTNVDHPLPVDADTLFQIGSITKTVTATAALRLVEQGKLALDAPLRAYLPDLRLADEAAAAGVTLRHLFTHTGGWLGDYFEDFGEGDDALARYVASMASLSQETPLGALFSYNNAGFSLAGRVIEVVTGMTYEAAVKALVLDPLGMTRAFYSAADAITERTAAGHNVDDGPPAVARPWALPRSVRPAGGIVTSVRDLFRYARFHLGDGRAADGMRALSPETMALMQSPLQATGGLTGGVGLAWMLREVDGVWIVGHGGGTNGQTTTFTLAPARNFALIILTNANRGGALIVEASKRALQRYLGLNEPEPKPLDLSAAHLEPYTGRYAATLSDVEVSVRDGGLVMQVIPKGGFPAKDSPPRPAPPPTRLAVYAEDRVVALDEPFKDARSEFVRDAAGGVAWLRAGGRLHRRVG
jgi:CubicO group peptidase (beta-lactamase class C family)